MTGTRRMLVVGASGLVGRALLRALGDRGIGTYRTRPGPGLVQLLQRSRLRRRGRPHRVAFRGAMPIYDYRCRTCHKRFAVFFRSFSEVAAVTCQHCGSADVGRTAPRVAQLTSEDARLDRLSDPSALGDVDENDPGSVARWAKRLGREMGEDLGDEFDDAMDGLAEGDPGDEGEPDPMPYSAGEDDS